MSLTPLTARVSGPIKGTIRVPGDNRFRTGR